MAEAKMTLLDWLDDLTVRFLLNLPQSELSSVPRLCFQVEEAHWYYEDFIRPLAGAAGHQLPNLPLRQFCLLLFQHCPLLSGFSDDEHIAAYEEFLAYKVRVPVRGAILLDGSMEQVLLVRGWKKGSSWSFPRGKINKDEPDLDCAIREVWEETGYNLRTAGLIPENADDVKHIDIVMREQHMRLFVFRDVPLDTVFETQTRKEISKIQWYNLRALPGFAKKNRQDIETGNANKYYMVAPFLGPLKKWIALQRKNDNAAAAVLERSPLRKPVLVQRESGADNSDAAVAATEAQDRSHELRRMLSIGGPQLAQRDQVPPQLNPEPQAAHARNLLAMLQCTQPGSQNAPPPQTPFEQILKQPACPQSPQPHHPRHPYAGYPQAPLQLLVPPTVLQRAQQPFNTASPAVQAHSFNANARNVHQPQTHQQNAVPMHPASLHGQGLNAGTQPPFQQMQPFAQQTNVESEHAHPSQQVAQGPGAIAAGPTVPNASQLPPPRLNLHAMALLDAFKSGNKSLPTATIERTPRLQNPHQAALMGLFKHSASVVSPPVDSSSVPDTNSAISPTGSDLTAKPSSQQARKTTLNEITRTLPRVKKLAQPSIVTGEPAHELDAVQDHDGTVPHQPAPQSLQQGNVSAPKQNSSQKPGVTLRTGITKTPNSSLRTKPNGAKTGPASPSFTILTRPGSAKDRSVADTFRKPDSVHSSAEDGSASLAPNVRSQALPSVPANDSKTQERLLALFSKPPARQPAQAPVSTETRLTPPADANKAAMLGLFNASSEQTSPESGTARRPQPPRAPALQPASSTARAVSRPLAPVHTGHQSSLLDLLREGSPGFETPISPFALGSPDQVRHQTGSSRSRFQDEPLRSRLGSFASSDRATATATTPEGAKDFLLGYLNGVVLKEGLGRK